MVWKNTERVGFGIAVGSDGMTRVVANYAPGGNFNFNKPSGAAANVDMADSKLLTAVDIGYICSKVGPAKKWPYASL